ncbi:hypothetical protein RFI_32612, partial [Reticulomyxa filosa]
HQLSLCYNENKKELPLNKYELKDMALAMNMDIFEEGNNITICSKNGEISQFIYVDWRLFDIHQVIDIANILTENIVPLEHFEHNSFYHMLLSHILLLPQFFNVPNIYVILYFIRKLKCLNQLLSELIIHSFSVANARASLSFKEVDKFMVFNDSWSFVITVDDVGIPSLTNNSHHSDFKQNSVKWSNILVQIFAKSQSIALTLPYVEKLLLLNQNF